MFEVWKRIADFPDYEVSDLGRIRRCVSRGAAKAGRLLKPGIVPNKPYLVVGLVRDGKRYPLTVHRVVMDAFIGHLPAGMDRSHINGDASDNRLVNLVFETKSENNQRKVARGTAPRGANNGKAKLTAGQVTEIRELTDQGCTQESLASRFGVHRSTIGKIVNDERWSHHPQPSGAQRVDKKRQQPGEDNGSVHF